MGSGKCRAVGFVHENHAKLHAAVCKETEQLIVDVCVNAKLKKRNKGKKKILRLSKEELEKQLRTVKPVIIPLEIENKYGIKAIPKIDRTYRPDLINTSQLKKANANISQNPSASDKRTNIRSTNKTLSVQRYANQFPKDDELTEEIRASFDEYLAGACENCDTDSSEDSEEDDGDELMPMASSKKTEIARRRQNGSGRIAPSHGNPRKYREA